MLRFLTEQVSRLALGTLVLTGAGIVFLTKNRLVEDVEERRAKHNARKDCVALCRTLAARHFSSNSAIVRQVVSELFDVDTARANLVSQKTPEARAALFRQLAVVTIGREAALVAIHSFLAPLCMSTQAVRWACRIVDENGEIVHGGEEVVSTRPLANAIGRSVQAIMASTSTANDAAADSMYGRFGDHLPAVPTTDTAAESMAAASVARAAAAMPPAGPESNASQPLPMPSASRANVPTIPPECLPSPPSSPPVGATGPMGVEIPHSALSLLSTTGTLPLDAVDLGLPPVGPRAAPFTVPSDIQLIPMNAIRHFCAVAAGAVGPHVERVVGCVALDAPVTAEQVVGMMTKALDGAAVELADGFARVVTMLITSGHLQPQLSDNEQDHAPTGFPSRASAVPATHSPSVPRGSFGDAVGAGLATSALAPTAFASLAVSSVAPSGASCPPSPSGLHATPTGLRASALSHPNDDLPGYGNPFRADPLLHAASAVLADVVVCDAFGFVVTKCRNVLLDAATASLRLDTADKMPFARSVARVVGVGERCLRSNALSELRSPPWPPEMEAFLTAIL